MSGTRVHSHGSSEAADLTASLLFANEATGTILGTWALDFGFPLYEITLCYERGRVRMQGLDGELRVLDYSSNHEETYSITRQTSRWDHYAASFRASITAYLRSVRSDEPPPVPGIWGLRELQLEAAFRRSAALGRPVKLEEELPLAGASE